MKKNPFVVSCVGGHSIAFLRNTNPLVWIQDLTGRKLKSPSVDRPVVVFATREEAEAEIRGVVLNYMYENDKGVEFIVGWD